MSRYDLQKGDKVYYTAPHGAKENGILKRIDENLAFVVFHCDNDWVKYENYTAASCQLSDINYGWVDEKGTILKQFCDHHYVANNTKWTPINRATCDNCGDVIN